jgi:hypothetical protein
VDEEIGSSRLYDFPKVFQLYAEESGFKLNFVGRHISRSLHVTWGMMVVFILLLLLLAVNKYLS